ncbi:hypothetical protein BGZ50_004612 [Haplosporangium sp. Z 11]|nr:hypothetical protein BGZ50_004612 [Haplosporangium sp. Z 11]
MSVTDSTHFTAVRQHASEPVDPAPSKSNERGGQPSAESLPSPIPHRAGSAAVFGPPRPPSTLPPLSSGAPKNGSSTVIGPGFGTEGGDTVIDPRLPVSRLSMVQPKQNVANPPLFAVGSFITFEWVFDNTTLVFPPTSLTVEVRLNADPKMVWTVANVSGTATSVVWNTGAMTSPVLFMGFYTLSIYDPKIGKLGIATSGHLMPYSDLQFGLYIPCIVRRAIVDHNRVLEMLLRNGLSQRRRLLQQLRL